MDGKIQTAYPRKNWSSLILFNCAHPQTQRLTPDLVNRESGKGVGVTLFEDEEAMRRGDEALNAMNPGGTEQRTSVEFFEVPVHTVS